MPLNPSYDEGPMHGNEVTTDKGSAGLAPCWKVWGTYTRQCWVGMVEGTQARVRRGLDSNSSATF
jgi:hypothetical protein